jgi:hypothetical protein
MKPMATLTKLLTSPVYNRFDRIRQEDDLIVFIQTLLDRWQWKPIRHCPGRFVLVTTDQPVPLDALLGSDYHAQTFASNAAKDRVLVVLLEDGGLISYARADGRMVHTLNTSEGFSRKLSQLGISLNPSTAQ